MDLVKDDFQWLFPIFNEELLISNLNDLDEVI